MKLSKENQNNQENIENRALTRRQFIRLPFGVIAALTARYFDNYLSPDKENPKILAKNSRIVENQEPQDLPFDNEIELFLTEYISTHQPLFSNKTELETKKELDEKAELERLLAIQTFKESISVPIKEINSDISTLYLRGFVQDFSILPDVIESRNNPNTEESIKKIISLLSVQSRETIKRDRSSLVFNNTPEVVELQKKINVLYSLMRYIDYRDSDYLISNYKGYANLWSRLFPRKSLPDTEILNEQITIYGNKMNMLWDKFYDHRESFDPEVIKTWDNQVSCNLYASTFFACLIGEKYFSHRVDSQNNPMIYVYNKLTNSTDFFIEGKDGQLVKPLGQVRELSAKGQHNWMIEHGKEHGWVDVTNLDYSQKLSMLKEGYVFYGSTEGHNWVIVGLTVNGEFQPFLTQATYNNLLGAFKRPEDIQDENSSGNNSLFYSINSDYYSAGYKLMPQFFPDQGAKIFAIKVKK